MTPKVSVILPTYNVEKYIYNTIMSVIEQTFQLFEIIIVDDCSDDKTLDIIKKFKDPRIKVYINKVNKGPSFSRNRALSLARGEWIAILDSDDWWEKQRLERLLSLNENKTLDIICDNLQFFYEKKEIHNSKTVLDYVGLEVKKLTYINIKDFVGYDLGLLKPIIKKSFLLENNIMYREDIRYGEDFIFLFNCLMRNGNMIVTEEPLYNYRIRQGSLIQNKIQLNHQIIKSTREIIYIYKDCLDGEIIKLLEKKLNRSKESLLVQQILNCIKEKDFLNLAKKLSRNPVIIYILLRKSIQKLVKRMFLCKFYFF